MSNTHYSLSNGSVTLCNKRDTSNDLRIDSCIDVVTCKHCITELRKEFPYCPVCHRCRDENVYYPNKDKVPYCDQCGTKLDTSLVRSVRQED